MSETTKYITVEVESSTFKTLIQAAATIGAHVQSFAGLMILRGLTSYANALDSDPQLKLFSLAQSINDDRENFRAALYVMRNLLDRPNDDQLQKLIELCDQMGIDIRSVEQQAHTEKESPFGMVSIGRRASKIDQAKDWLIDNMQPNTPYRAAEMTEKAVQAGFSKQHLQAARAAAGVSSHRGSEGFEWTIHTQEVSIK